MSRDVPGALPETAGWASGPGPVSVARIVFVVSKTTPGAAFLVRAALRSVGVAGEAVPPDKVAVFARELSLRVVRRTGPRAAAAAYAAVLALSSPGRCPARKAA